MMNGGQTIGLRFRTRVILVIALLANSPTGLIATKAQPSSDPESDARSVAVRVDPRVELLSLIFRLAGSPEYNQPNSISRYSREIDRQFGPFRDHPVVDAARDFITKSGFASFVAEKAEHYKESALRLRGAVERGDYVAWLDTYFGARPGASFTAIVGMLNGGANYGVGIRFPDGREEINPVLGAKPRIHLGRRSRRGASRVRGKPRPLPHPPGVHASNRPLLRTDHDSGQ